VSQEQSEDLTTRRTERHSHTDFLPPFAHALRDDPINPDRSQEHGCAGKDAGDIAAALSVSPPLLSRHLRVLRKSGLIENSEVEHDARVRVYRLRPERFAILRNWLEEVEAFWAAELSAFKAHAERTRGRPRV
jgi:DNA-binding MarR family transcriptional regulator